jgi:hypothetical protein
MTLIEAKLKCGCSGHERIDHDSVEIRFLVQVPCAQHRQLQWLRPADADVAWRDWKQMEYWTKAKALEQEWRDVNAAALARGENPQPGLIAFIVARLHPNGLEDDDFDELDE